MTTLAPTAAILAALADRSPQPPGDLIRALVAAGHADAEVRAAIWYLIDDGLLTLTKDFDIALA